MLNLKKILTKVLTAITITKTTGTIASEYSSANEQRCELLKIGNVVHMDLALYINTNTDITRNSTIFTIPTAFRPSSTLSVPAVIVRTEANGGTFGGHLTIYADGRVYMPNSNTRSVLCSASWNCN